MKWSLDNWTHICELHYLHVELFQNFLNAYCTCQRPYPDPEAAEEMIQVQCTLCEDWFHLQHVLKNTEDLEARLEIPKSLVCRACREKHPFVNYYVAEEGDLVGEFDHSQPVGVKKKLNLIFRLIDWFSAGSLINLFAYANELTFWLFILVSIF